MILPVRRCLMRHKPKQAEASHRSDDLSDLNHSLLDLLSGINIGVVMLSPDLRIRHFTHQAEKVLGLGSRDVGRPITDIGLNLDLPHACELILETVETGSARRLEIQDEGRWYSLWIRPSRSGDDQIDGV